jgi:hypothetical protein
LLAGDKGTFFGTGFGGGNFSASGGTDGAVFEISASGAENVLYEFRGGDDGLGPQATLRLDAMFARVRNGVRTVAEQIRIH